MRAISEGRGGDHVLRRSRPRAVRSGNALRLEDRGLKCCQIAIVVRWPPAYGQDIDRLIVFGDNIHDAPALEPQTPGFDIGPREIQLPAIGRARPVSYTHLTLPTIYSV
mgnify:CR=1 FL=1